MSEMVERVGAALEDVQLFSRWNDWTSDRVEGMPIEICRHEGDEIVVVRRFDATWKEGDALRLSIREALAVAAIKAMRIPSKAMLDAVEAEEEKRGYVASAYETMDAETAWPIMVDAALSGHEEKRSGE